MKKINYCIDCNKILTGHGKPKRCPSCAKKGKVSPLKGRTFVADRTIYCIDCGKKLGSNAYYLKSKRCFVCAKIGELNHFFGKHHSKKTKNKLRIKIKKLNMIGEKHSCWKGGKTINRGYISIFQPNHPFNHNHYVRKHRLVVEQQIGRYLQRGEVVHHLGKKTDNRPKMLIAFINNSAHKRFHNNPNNVKPEEIIFDGRII
jgi:uncharacterized protein (DUF1330 family)